MPGSPPTPSPLALFSKSSRALYGLVKRSVKYKEQSRDFSFSVHIVSGITTFLQE